MKVVVGSKNPVKVGAVEEAFRKYWPDCIVEGVEALSGVSEQPRSEEETINGAINRAKNSIGDNDYGVGVEGGVCVINNKMFDCAWVAIIDKTEKIGLSGGLYFELPDKIAQKIQKGGELGPIMNEMTGEENVKQKMGAIGIFTKGELDRKQAYVQIVLSALIKFVSPEWF
ncbi:MAG: inosine/xanthosine triphosphatase [Microgenomates group bacterium]